jgi:heme-degrading monooxygenase HmoA
MVLRVWRGYTAPPDADTYETMLRETILPGIHRVKGYRGAYLARRDHNQEVEFLTITLWESMDAVRAFSTDGRAVIHDAAHSLLIRFDDFSAHYEASFVP